MSINQNPDVHSSASKMIMNSEQHGGLSNIVENFNKDKDIPMFDSGEFCGDKPKSRETIINLSKIPEHKREEIIQDELKISKDMMTKRQLQKDSDIRFSDENSEDGKIVMPINYNLRWKGDITVKSSNLNAKEKALMCRVSKLLHDMQYDGDDNADELHELLDQLNQWGTFNDKQKDESLHEMVIKIMDMLNIPEEEREEMFEA